MMRSLLEDRFKLKVHRGNQRGSSLCADGCEVWSEASESQELPCFVMGSGPPVRGRAAKTPPPFCGNGRVKPDGLEVHEIDHGRFLLGSLGPTSIFTGPKTDR